MKQVVNKIYCSYFVDASPSPNPSYVQQYFLEAPSNVTKFDHVQLVIPCRIENLVGNVQWSKDGMMLGFDPEIPGFPRYSMIVDKNRGIYNLLIKGTELEDEGHYECQASGNSFVKPIRASAFVKIHS